VQPIRGSIICAVWYFMTTFITNRAANMMKPYYYILKSMSSHKPQIMNPGQTPTLNSSDP